MDISPKKSLGQHFLKNEGVAKRMVEAGEVQKGEHVVEVGPGTGVLTKYLLEAGAQVSAIEADERAIETLNTVFKEAIALGTLSVIHGDIRTFDLKELDLEDGAYKVIANIPYYISGMLFRLFLTHRAQPNTLVFLVQKEVAERIARSKKESLLSLSVKAYGTPAYIETVRKGNFTPPPKVDSAILQVGNISRDYFNELNENHFFHILKTGFSSRRKQLKGNLKAITDLEFLEKSFTECSIATDARGEDLPIDTWVCVAHALDGKLYR